MDLRELYQDVILDHNRNPQNFGKPDASNRQADGHNPLCGDKLTVYLEVDGDDNVIDASFEGSGCAISTASASLMTEFLKGRPRGEVEEMFEKFHELCAGSPDESADASELGKLAVFAGVREFPMRVKCATLAWHTMKAALDEQAEPVKTE